jgi:hypothetical protein
MKAKLALSLLILIVGAVLAQASTTTVYYTPKGGKYHTQNCRTLKKSKVVLERTVDQVKEMGLVACQVCNPPR